MIISFILYVLKNFVKCNSVDVILLRKILFWNPLKKGGEIKKRKNSSSGINLQLIDITCKIIFFMGGVGEKIFKMI